MNLNKTILIVFFTYFLSTNLFAQEKKNIIIKGNEYIDDEVIYSIVGENFDKKSDNYINSIIKSLNDTGNFKKIEVEENNNELIIKIVENEKVKKVNFEGNKRFKKDVILELFNEKEYFQYINEIKINEFIDELKNIYLSYGYNQISIEYKITKDLLDNNFAVLDFFISEGKISKINKIYFIGNIFFNKRELLSEIKSKEQNFLVLFGDKNFKKYQVNNDLISLKSFYRNNGFKDISIDYKTEYLISKNKFNIYFYINEGKKYQFGQIDFDTKSINISDLQKEELKSIFKKYYLKKIKKNNNYNRSYMDDMKNILSDFLFNNGIMFFEIIILDKVEESTVDVVFLIEPAKPKYVNQINVYGNRRTLDKVIRREVTFAEGDAINSELIRNTKRNIDGLRIFSNVQIDEVFIKDDQIDVDIKVEEKSTGEFQVGLSVGTLEGATFVTGLKEKNISGLGREIDLQINTSEKHTKYNFGIIEPYVFNKKMNFLYAITYQENDYSKKSSYNLDSFSTNAGFRYILSDDLVHTIALEYILKDYEITDSSTVSNNIKKLEGGNADILLKNDFTYNQLNSFLRPSKGTWIKYNNIFSPVTNSDNGFIKNILIHKKYYKFKSNILSIQTKIGNIFSLQNEEIPTDNKFSLGGRWLRGFDSYGVGPRNSRTSYVGGNNIVVSKIDLQRPLNNSSDNPIDLNFFTDIGTVFDNKEAPTNSKESIRASYGVGIKFYSPIGPIGFSWAFPISSESYDIERMFLFSIGNVN